MKPLIPFVLRSRLGGEQDWSATIPADVVYFSMFCDLRYYVRGPWGYIVCQVLQLAGVDIWDTQYFLNCAVELSSEIHQPFIEQHNSVQNHFMNNWDGNPLPTEREGQGGWSVGPYFNNTVRFTGRNIYRTTDFHYQLPALIPDANHIPALYELLNQYEHRQFAQAPQRLELGGDPRIILNHLYDPDCHPGLARRYLQNQADSFLITSLSKMAPLPRIHPANLSSRMVEVAMHTEDVLRMHYASPISLKQLSMIIGVNAEFMRRCFKARFGKTIIEYLNHYKVEQAKQLLTDTHFGLEAIATRTGFSDGLRLGRVFKQYTGMTPLTYRKLGRPPR